MFHRPKSEEQQSAKQEQEKPKQEQAQAPKPATEAKKEEMAQPTQPVNTQVKEEKSMNHDKPESRETDTSSTETSAGAPFQRPPHMQRSVAGGYASPYSGQPANQTAGMSTHTGEDRRLVIGQGITMSGEIEACDYLLVEGTLEAALKGAKVLEIAETGTFYGGVEIEEATVAGRFEGDLNVHGRLTIKSGGSVTGTVSYKELAIEAGAILDGKVSPLASASAQSADTDRKPMAPRNDNAGMEEKGSELPFSGNAAAAAE